MPKLDSGVCATINSEGHSAFFIDSHCHFDFAEFDCDRQNLWRSCANHNILGLIIPGVEPRQWPRAERICQDFSGVGYRVGFGVGLHPWWLSRCVKNFTTQDEACDALLAQQSQWLVRPCCVAVGECGLDKRIETPMHIQKTFFNLQLLIAKRHHKPLIIHSVKTHNDILKALKDHSFDAGGVIHAFSGSTQQAQDFIAAGFCIGVGGVITYERAKKTREAVKHIPLSSIVLETDAPDMPLAGRQGQRNTPDSIVEIAHVLADIRTESIDDIAQKTSANTMRLFGIGKMKTQYL